MSCIFVLFQSWITYSAAGSGCGGRAEEARDGRTAGRCTGVGRGGNARVGAVCGHGHHARAAGEVVAGGRGDLGADARVGSREEALEDGRGFGGVLGCVGGEEGRCLAGVLEGP